MYVIKLPISNHIFFPQDSVIIFDEGHNVPNECEENFQFEVSSYNLINGINSVEAVCSSF